MSIPRFYSLHRPLSRASRQTRTSANIRGDDFPGHSAPNSIRSLTASGRFTPGPMNPGESTSCAYSARLRLTPRTTPLNDSLSIIVPVRNAEATLAGHIGRLLDLLPDLTDRFE